MGASAFADQALVNRAARASRPCGIDPSRKGRSCPSSEQKRKTGPLCSSHLHKGPALSTCRDTERLQRMLHILWRGFALRPECDPEAQSLSRGYDYFFFFEVFFATFLVACHCRKLNPASK